MRIEMNQRRLFQKSKMSTMIISLIATILLVVAPDAEARRGGRDPVQPGKNNCRLAKGSIKMPGYPIFNSADVHVATKRVTVLWRYVDANCDGVMTWGGEAVDGADYLRVVPRTQYDFLLDFEPSLDLHRVARISTHHFGPSVNSSTIATSFRVVVHDDFIVGLPAPGDLSLQLFDGGPQVPGITGAVYLFTATGDVVSVPAVMTTWGAQFRVTFAQGASVIPAGAIGFFDSQLNVYDIVPTGTPDPVTGLAHCEAGFWEEDFINGASQEGPNTANTRDPNVVPVPIHFSPQCSNNTTP